MITQAAPCSVLQQFVERAGTLYSLPAVAVEVLELTSQENVDPVALRLCVQRDPALTARLLRVVNSSMFGLSREVSDLNQALALLGVKPLKLLVLGFSLPKELHAGVEAETLSRFWRFTLVKAVAASELSQAFWNIPGDEAFIAGLLQEIGVLVLVRELGDAYIGFLNGVHQRGEDLVELETATLGFDHAILSARLLDHWHLPASIVKAVSARFDAEYIQALPAAEAALVQTLHLATLIASIVALDRRDLLPNLRDAAARYRGVTVEQMNELLDQMQAQVALMADLFSVRMDQPESYHGIIARAHEQMSAAALDALPEMITSGRAAVADEQEALLAALDGYSRRFFATSTAAATRLPGESASAGPAPSLQATPRVGVGARRVSSADPGLRGKIQSAIAVCRARQRELSLILVELEDYARLLVTYGPQRMTRIVDGVRRAAQDLSDLPCDSLVVTDARCAVVLPDCDRRQAVAWARVFHDALAAWLTQHEAVDTPLSFCSGIASLATPTQSSRPEDVIEAADRCLFAAMRSGGGAVKSIDVL